MVVLKEKDDPLDKKTPCLHLDVKFGVDQVQLRFLYLVNNTHSMIRYGTSPKFLFILF